MARIAGVDLPTNKRVEIGLTYIYGIGRSTSKGILDNLKISYDKKIKDLTEEEVDIIRKTITDEYVIEGDYSRRSAREAAEKLLSLGTPPTAIFAANATTSISGLAI